MARFLGLRGRSLASAISVTCGLCFLCFGYAQGVMGGLLTVQQFLSRYPQVDILENNSFHDAWVTGLTVGTWHLGCIVSAVATIFVGDLLGRRRTLLLGLTFWVIGEIIQTSSYSFAQFIVGRAVAGFGNGFTTATAPAYQAECVKSHRKGTILMISAGAFVSAGITLSYWFVFGFAYISSSSASWRVPIALQIVFALPAIAMLFALPESPRWLILTGREQEALTVLAALNDDEPDSFDTKDEFLQIKDAILIMAQGSGVSMFSNKERRGFHRVVLAYFVQVFQQGTGINLVMQYLSWIFLTRMAFDGWLARLLASCSATLYFLASFVAVVGIDRFWGRRSLMMFGAAGMSSCMILITILQYLWSEKGMREAKIASTVFLFIFSVFFAIGWQGMAWLYQVEIVPLRIRGPANGLSTSANWLLNFVIVFITPIAFERISYRTWIIFAATNSAIVPIVYFFYPETAFRSLEEVDVIFQLADEDPGNTWLNAVRISKSEPLWYGKQDPEKRLNFNYGNTSWHKRLLESAGSGKSGSRGGTIDGNDEKRPRTNSNSPRSENMIISGSRGRMASDASAIDPYLYGTPSLSTTVTKTATSDHERKHSHRRLQKRPSRTSSLGSTNSYARTPPAFDPFSTKLPTPPTQPARRRTRSTTPDSLRMAPSHHDSWAEDSAPAPIIPRSRSASQTSHPMDPPRTHRSSLSLSNNTPNRVADPDAYATVRSFYQHTASASASSSFPSLLPDPVAQRDSIEYPGRLDDDDDDDDDERRGRQAAGIVVTDTGRETYLPDGVYEVVQGRVRQLSVGTAASRTGSRGAYAAREAGRGR